MSKYRRPVFSRPRTKVYDTNYNIGESYYKSALDGLDRKYGRPGLGGGLADSDVFSLPVPQPTMERAPSAERSFARKEMDEFFDRDKKSQASALMDEFDELTNRMKNGMQRGRTPVRGNRSLEDEMEEEMASSMRKLKAVKLTKSMADEFEEDALLPGRESRFKSKLDFSDKLMDSVGLTGKARAALEEEGSTTGRRRFLKMTTDSGTSSGEELTKWTALKPALPRKQMLDVDDVDMSNSAAAARARKSRARLEDLESEMQALSERSAAREKRVRDLKALVQENEANAMDNLQTTVKVSTSIQEKKVTF